MMDSLCFSGFRRAALAACVGLASLVLIAVDAPVDGFADDTLRVCVLSDDMPLSSERPDAASGRSGLYLDLATSMAKAQNATMTTHFAVTAFYKRPVREGLLAGKCDAYFGLPRTEGPWFIRNRVALSKPFTSIGYAIVTKAGERVTTLDGLRGRTVAVQGGSPAALAVALVDGIDTYTVRYPDEAMQALQDGLADAAFVWGPRAGYLSRFVYPDTYDVQPTTLRWPVAIGVRAADRDRLATFDALIDRLAKQTYVLRATYGLPDGEPVVVSIPGVDADDDDGPRDGPATGDVHRSSPRDVVHGVGKSGAWPFVEPVLRHRVPYATPTARRDTMTGDPEAGQRMFNAIYGCAHCHGTNAEGATAPTDLRKLVARYGGEQEARRAFNETVREGRPETAMPPWKGILSDEKIADIEAFIFSIQTDE